MVYSPSVKYRFATLQSSLFFGFAGLIGLILAVAFAFFYAFFSAYCEDSVSNRQLNLCSSISESIDAEILKMNTVSMNVVYSNLVSENLRDYLGAGGSSPGRVGKWKSAGTIYDILWSIIGPFQTVSQVNIYTPSGAVVGAGMYNALGEVELRGKSWYAAALALGGSRYVGLPERIPSLELRNAALKDHAFVPLARVFSSSKFVTEGFVEVLQDAMTVFAPAERARRINPEIEVYVLDAEGRPAYPLEAEGSREAARLAGLAAEGRLVPLRMARVPAEGGPKVATLMRSEYSLWSVVVAESRERAYLPLRSFTVILAAASLAMLALGWLGTFLAARGLAVPLTELKGALAGMDAEGLVDSGLAPPSIGRSSVRELDELGLAFGGMYGKLRASTRELVETRSEETKAQMLALQSLMNPHFVYNNLATIGAMADEGLTAEIKSMCEDVSAILRYVSSEAENGVTLGEEIAVCEKYLKCMKVRYGDSLSYEIAVDEAMLGVVVPKLVVQPLVENSIQHGFELSPPWRVSVRGSIRGGLWRVEVSDNGIGFDPEPLARLRSQIAEWADSGKLPPLGLGGMGLLNIVLRLRMLYGEDYVFEADGGAARGARVEIGGRVDGS
jgi:two-component system, sensor histidine kinase YesM